MTATVARPDVVDVLKRADGQYAKRAGDDPAIPEYLTALATAVRPLLGQPTAAPAKVDDVQVKQLLADKQRLETVVEEQRKILQSSGKEYDRIARENTALQKQVAEADADTKRRIDAAVGAVQTATGAMGGKVDELRRELAAKDKEINEARAARDSAVCQLREQGPVPDGALAQAQTDNARLADELAAVQEQLSTTRRNLELANRTLDEIADEQASAPAVVVHSRHYHPVSAPGEQPDDCECGHPWPRNPASFEVEETVDPDVEPWSAVLGQVRGELDGRWPA